MECKRNKWDCEEGGGCGCFWKVKLKGNGEVSGCGVNGIIAGVQEMERPREGVAILLNDVWHIGVIDFGCVSEGECMECCSGDEPLTLTRCYCYELPELYDHSP